MHKRMDKNCEQNTHRNTDTHTHTHTHMSNNKHADRTAKVMKRTEKMRQLQYKKKEENTQ